MNVYDLLRRESLDRHAFFGGPPQRSSRPVVMGDNHSASTPEELQRSLGLLDAVVIGLGSMLGSRNLCGLGRQMMRILLLHSPSGDTLLKVGTAAEYVRDDGFDTVLAVLDGEDCVKLLRNGDWVATAQPAVL